jgi:hypothetical protein
LASSSASDKTDIGFVLAGLLAIPVLGLILGTLVGISIGARRADSAKEIIDRKPGFPVTEPERRDESQM